MLNGKPAVFIMDTEDGTISAWNGGTQTTLEVDNSADPAQKPTRFLCRRNQREA
jgi:hypothetical protein